MGGWGPCGDAAQILKKRFKKIPLVKAKCKIVGDCVVPTDFVYLLSPKLCKLAKEKC